MTVLCVPKFGLDCLMCATFGKGFSSITKSNTSSVRSCADIKLVTASERKGNTFEGFQDFSLKAKAMIWP